LLKFIDGLYVVVPQLFLNYNPRAVRLTIPKLYLLFNPIYDILELGTAIIVQFCYKENCKLSNSVLSLTLYRATLAPVRSLK
jgi:hypothetical protein